MQVSSLAVMIEDIKDLNRTVMSPEGVGRHGGELRRLSSFHEDGPFSQLQACGPREDREPLPAGMHASLHFLGPSSRSGDANLGNGHPIRGSFLGSQDPGGHPAHDVALRSDDDVVVLVRLQQLIEAGVESTRDRNELIDGHSSMARLNTAQG